MKICQLTAINDNYYTIQYKFHKLILKFEEGYRKMRSYKKSLSLILSALMFVSIINTVMAEKNPDAVYEKFDALSIGQLNGPPENFVEVNDNFSPDYYIENGRFGKSEDDKALRINQYFNSDGRFQYYQARYTTDKDVSEAAYLHYSTEIAAEYGTSNRWLAVALTMENSKVASPEFRFATMESYSGDDRTIMVSFPGTDKTIVIPERSWIKFDVVMDVATGISDIYYNGEAVVTDYQATYKGGQMTAYENINQVRTISLAEFGIEQINYNGGYHIGNTYLDNIMYDGVNQYPEINKFVSYDEVDFGLYSGGFPEGFGCTAADDSCTNALAVNGIFGKDASDISMDIKTSAFTQSGDSPARWQQIRYNNPALEYMDNKSKYWRVSFNMAYTGTGMNRWVGLRYKMGNGGDQTGETEVSDIILINGNDDRVTMTVGGNSVTVSSSKFSENKWLKFDILINASVLGSASYDVYMNGEKLTGSPVPLNMPDGNKGWYSLSKITQIMFGVNHLWNTAENKYPEAHTYLDDISIKHYGALPEDLDVSTGSPRSLIMGRYDGFADWGAHVRATAENTSYNGEKCTLLKGNDETGDNDLYLGYGSAPEKGTFTQTTSFVATNTADSIYFATGGHTPIMEKLPMSEFEPGTWNTMTVVVNRSTGVNDLYVNGKYHSSTTSPIKNNTMRTIVTKASGKTVNDIEIYLDNYTMYTGKPDIPAVTSDILSIEGATLSGYAGMTIGEIKANISCANEYYTIDIIDGGESVSDETPASKGMQMNIWDVNIFIQSYTFGVSGYEFGEVTGYSNGYVDEKFTEGEYTFEIEAKNYGKPLNVIVIAAQYDVENNSLNKVKLDNQELKGAKTLRLTMEIEKAEGTCLKFMVWDKDTLRPYINPKTVYPYDDASVEKVVKMFEGFTTKAFTMSYDDGETDDVEMIRILNKYGAKATFNLIGSTLLKNYAAYGNTEDEIYAAIKEVYKDHEIASHSYSHPAIFLNNGEIHTDSGGGKHNFVPLADAIKEVADNNILLKEKLGAKVQGIAWPFKYPDNRVAEELEQIQQAAVDTGTRYERFHDNASFDLPTDWMRWSPTCHRSEAPRFTNEFVNLKNSDEMKIYYVWGHSYEYRNNWSDLENMLKPISSANIWMATNGEIYEYITALDKVAVNGKTVENNSDKTVYLRINGKQVRLQPDSAYELSDESTNKSIACWGDSLTWGQGASETTETYPAVLEKLTGNKVYNMGVAGETAYTIAARQGAYDIVLANDVTIPAQGSVEVMFTTAEGGIIVPRSAEFGGWNPCTINGIEGQLKCEIDTNDWPRTVKKATFTRIGIGEASKAKAGDKIIPSANNVKADINVIFIGTNGGWDKNNEDVKPNDAQARENLIKIIKDMLANTPNPDSYVVVGLTWNSYDWTALNNDCRDAFGEKYLEIKSSLASERALEKVGITPSDADLNAISEGKIPKSLLLSDEVHFNSSGYRLIANMIYERLNELEYLYD